MSKRDRTVSCLLGLLLGPAVALGALYWTYCWGWWGQHRLLQLLFQCSCPAASEEARYPETVDVLFSACTRPWLYGNLSPSGRFVLASLAQPTRGFYRYDFQTGRLQSDPWPPATYFLTDELGIKIKLDDQTGAESYYLYDLNGNKLMQLNWIEVKRDHSFAVNALSVFQSAEKVYILQVGSAALAVALAPDYSHQPEANFVFGRYSDYETSLKEINKILQDNQIKFEIPASREISPNGLFKYNFGHIDLVAEKRTITEGYQGYNFYRQGWVYQDRGVILQSNPVYLIGTCCDVFISPTFFPIPQPILLLKVPKEYLSPAARQAEEAHEAQEQVAKWWALIEFWVVVVIVMVAFTLNVIHGWKRAK
jgi:hypothetical protein